MKYKKEWIGRTVTHYHWGIGTIREFQNHKEGGEVLVYYKKYGKLINQPYPESFFKEESYTLEPDMWKEFIMLNYEEWLFYKAAITALKYVNIPCERCGGPTKHSEYKKYLIRTRNDKNLCAKCISREEKKARKLEKKQQKKKGKKKAGPLTEKRIAKEEKSFVRFQNMMWHDKPISSKKYRPHPTDGMNIERW